jgi:hypothetical protein
VLRLIIGSLGLTIAVLRLIIGSLRLMTAMPRLTIGSLRPTNGLLSLTIVWMTVVLALLTRRNAVTHTSRELPLGPG